MSFQGLVDAARDELFELVHLGHPTPPDASKLKLKAEPKPVQPKLDLADYVATQADPPPAVHRTNLEIPQLHDPLGNLRWGDCGDAMFIHGLECIQADAGRRVSPFVEKDALNLYSAVSGFDPGQTRPDGSNPTDTGTDNQQLVDFVRDTGARCAADATTHKIAGSLFVDPADERIARIAIWEFVVLFAALGLPTTAQGQTHWTLTDPTLQGDAAVGSWGYHDVPDVSYDSERLRAWTWGQPFLVDWAFQKAYAVQHFVVVTREMLNLRGVSPAGVDWTRLNADMAKFPPAPAN